MRIKESTKWGITGIFLIIVGYLFCDHADRLADDNL
jgi:hypothetical protein